jgi:hypothetical protein
VVKARPATPGDALDFAGGRSLLRKALLWQVRNHPSEVIETAAGEPLALVMLQWHSKARVEVSIHFRPLARQHMAPLVRLAQLTLARLGQDGVMAMASVRDTNAAGQRMARLAGLRPVRLTARTLWITMRKKRHVNDAQRAVREQGPGEAAGDREAAAER